MRRFTIDGGSSFKSSANNKRERHNNRKHASNVKSVDVGSNALNSEIPNHHILNPQKLNPKSNSQNPISFTIESAIVVVREFFTFSP
ncbi:hypothetical protein L6452_44135 [Arctium lappa]|uniref:Uncharacterized protein n=1 Tax=Arctium lappa TaxID=4217 RepID=A0ACB8XFD7_ARCLA|nr:hypothetical protein L6452_44135 [Arctium lappa]